jgi:uncharacterized paraquat-inducible protein A
MSWKYIWLLGGGVAVIAATVWTTRPAPPKSVGDPSRFRFLYCPECGREKAYTPVEKDHQCLYCDKPMIGAAESIKQARGTSPYARTAMLVFTELVGLMAVAWYLARPRPTDPDEEFIYYFCEGCGQKIRYRETQIGHMALCPRCKRPFVFPELDPDEVI